MLSVLCMPTKPVSCGCEYMPTVCAGAAGTQGECGGPNTICILPSAYLIRILYDNNLHTSKWLILDDQNTFSKMKY